MKSIFDTLMDLPLFKGVSKERMAKTVGTTKFHFVKYPLNETFVKQGDDCTELIFILSGKVQIQLETKTFTISQIHNGEYVIFPEYLFGKSTKHPATITALSDVSALHISKADYIEILHSDSVFLFNFLNTLSLYAQTGLENAVTASSGSIINRLINIISLVSCNNSTDIILKSKGCSIASILGTIPSKLNSTLKNFITDSIVDLTSDSIKVLDRAKLLALKK